MPARAAGAFDLHLDSWLEADVLRHQAEALLEGPGRERR
jgi:hypothetical protein